MMCVDEAPQDGAPVNSRLSCGTIPPNTMRNHLLGTSPTEVQGTLFLYTRYMKIN